jgi:hypothetical protein
LLPVILVLPDPLPTDISVEDGTVLFHWFASTAWAAFVFNLNQYVPSVRLVCHAAQLYVPSTLTMLNSGADVSPCPNVPFVEVPAHVLIEKPDVVFTEVDIVVIVPSELAAVSAARPAL